MADIDVFNGDADGICALTQLRLAEPRESTLITGVKRNISLLKTVTAQPGDRITVLDISMDKNRSDLERLLTIGAEVFYVDHHFPGNIPETESLTVLINEAPDTCTSLLVNQHLGNAFAAWAVVGAFGDNFNQQAQAQADETLQCSETDLRQLQKLGIYINYNGYGASVEDLHIPPDELFRRVSMHRDPLDFIHSDSKHFDKLENGYHSDMAAAAGIAAEKASATTAWFILPNEAWARRVSGVFSNQLTNDYPDRAHAVLTETSRGDYLVSVRAPLNNRRGAADLCRRFPTGGGRAAAAGINNLPTGMLADFIDAFEASYP
ncbi:DHH family phosphoesterase [Porticoccus sp.]|uniref:DHH family phosphoesterase n=1 Tax=Porticoccus sp. TaxID=2024853 RepID=UPI003F695375